MGAVLYTLLTQHAPFEGESVYHVLWRAMTEEPTPTVAYEPAVPRELVAVCQRAMQKEPAARYESAAALAREIERFQSGALVRTYNYNLGELGLRFLKRHKASLATALLALCVILVGSVVSYLRVLQERDLAVAAHQEAEWARNQADEARQEEFRAHLRAEREYYSSTFHVAREHIENGRKDLGQQLLWKAPERQRDWEWGYLLGLCCGSFGTVTSAPPVIDVSVPPEASADGDRLMTFAKDGSLAVWDTETLDRLALFEEPLAGVFSAAGAELAPDGLRVAVSLGSGGEDGRVVIWDVATGSESAVLSCGGTPVAALTFSPNGAWLAVGTSDGAVRLWDGVDGTDPLLIEGHTGRVTAMAFDAAGARLASASSDATTRMWGVETAAEVAVISGHRGAIRHVAFSPDGTHLATASEDGTARVWPVGGGPEYRVFGMDVPVLQVAFSPDGTTLAAISEAAVKIWRLGSGELVATLQGRSHTLNGTPFTPFGTRVVTVDENLARIWEVATGREIFSLPNVSYASFLPGGRRVLTVSEDGGGKVLSALPYRTEMLPGDEKMDWQERFALYMKGTPRD